METIARHRTRLLLPYRRSATADALVASAKHLARIVLASDELHERHRKKMLSDVLWLISEADGKYTTKFRSAEVIRLATEEPESQTKIQHEHVFTRKSVTEKILDNRERLLLNPNELDDLLDRTIGCVVTAAEHRRLSNSRDGWDRYHNVSVLDMSQVPPLRLAQTGVSAAQA